MIAAAPPADETPADGSLAEVSDRRLLIRFAERRDEAAFAMLVERYGGLALGAARGAAKGPGAAADADDALQATFLSLARNAGKLADRMGERRTLGGWLYRVAVNAVLQAKRSDVARRRRERIVAEQDRPAASTAAAGPAARAARGEALGALSEELAALPPAERGAVSLCHLQGRTQREAAAELGVPFGTFRRRLDRGRDRLRQRLEARGVTVGAAAFAAALLEAHQACAAPMHAAEAAAVAAEVGRRLPPPHVLAPRTPSPPAIRTPGPTALSWEPILTLGAGLAVAALALVGAFDLLGGGFAEEEPPAPAPVASRPDPITSGMM